MGKMPVVNKYLKIKFTKQPPDAVASTIIVDDFKREIFYRRCAVGVMFIIVPSAGISLWLLAASGYSGGIPVDASQWYRLGSFVAIVLVLPILLIWTSSREKIATIFSSNAPEESVSNFCSQIFLLPAPLSIHEESLQKFYVIFYDFDKSIPIGHGSIKYIKYDKHSILIHSAVLQEAGRGEHPSSDQGDRIFWPAKIV